LLRLGHVVPGFAGLVVFWLPIFSRKGKSLHKMAGKVFEFCCAIVLLSAMTSSVWMIASPMAFDPNFSDKSTAAQDAFLRRMTFISSLLGTPSIYIFVPLVLSRYWLTAKTDPQCCPITSLKIISND